MVLRTSVCSCEAEAFSAKDINLSIGDCEVVLDWD